MCGIGGFYGSYEVSQLQAMGGIMEVRGPDHAGIFHDPEHQVGLLHRRLSILDLSPTGHQPMLDASRKYVVTFNGEIYNYRSLKAQLVLAGHQFHGTSDTEVLLTAYIEYGCDMLSHLNGIFAFAIWDIREKTLFVARDQVGVKPCYYSETEKGFLFASELKALLTFKDVSREIDYEAVYNHLLFLYSPAEKTLLKGVRKLEPGCAMLVKDGRIVKCWRYYDLPYASDIPKYTSVESARDATQEGLLQAVNSQMVSDVPVGAFLSGGLDSSAIVSIAKRSNPDMDLQCFSIRLNGKEMNDEGFVDDLPFAERVAKHCDVSLNIVDVDASLIFQLTKMIYHLDEPQADPAPLNVLAISELARSQGIKVLLSGAGGDDLFTGYRRHFALQAERYWAFLPRVARTGIRNFTNLFPNNPPLLRRVKKAFQYADLPKEDRIASYFAWLHADKGFQLFSDEVKNLVGTYNPLERLGRNLNALGAGSSELDKMLYLEAKGFLPDHNLNYTDKMGMAASVEVRVPFLDVNLIKIASNIPDEYKQRGREGKWILKKAMEPYLPIDVIYRAKTGFGGPLRHWMKNQLKPLIDQVLSESSLSKRGVFDPESVCQMIVDDRSGRHDYSYTLFSLVCIELWFRMFVDPETPEILVL